MDTKRAVAALFACIMLCGASVGEEAKGGGVIASGDLIYVDVYRAPELSTTTQVDEQGSVTLPYVGKAKIAGMSEKQAAAVVSSALRQILRNPRVKVSRSAIGAQRGFRTAEMKTEIYPLKNASAESLGDALQGMSTEGGAISYHQESNSLVITDTPAAVQNIMSAITRLDGMESQRIQIRIAAKIAEVKVGAMKELGIKWFVQGDESSGGFYPPAQQSTAISSVKGASGNPLANEQFSSSGGTSNQAGRRFVGGDKFSQLMNIPVNIPKTGQLFYGLATNHVDLGVLIDALVSDDKAELLTNTSILTLNHREAEIKTQEEYPYKEFGAESSGRSTTETRFLPLGIQLIVTPHVHTDGHDEEYVRLELEPEVSFPVGAVDGVPIRSVRSTKMQPLARDGQTVVVGGIYRSDVQNKEQRVPGLGKVPLFGRLFKHTERTREQTELMIFVTPTIHRTPESVTWDRMLNLSSVDLEATGISEDKPKPKKRGE
jgi:general secretion pathway protein D